MTSSVHVANRAATAAERFGDEFVIIQFETGHYFSLGGLALPAWEILQVPASIEGMAAVLHAAAGDTSPGLAPLAAELERLVARFLESGLVLPAETEGTPPAITPFSYAPAVIETYSDLADLVSIDPVHDVDAMMGWPRSGAA
ncbi:hypothetical protein [Sediminicoccus sp. BL-A-41-H5]|uniref:hypothetical protein n=1 Tax=Sediminicoccus sp. BL-A-41-H5 TaxID=3421106 RepID=UPI003D66C51C